MQPAKHTFVANLVKPQVLHVNPKHDREPVKMQANQLPILINNATTGHKLQGSGVDCIFVHAWNYTTNWPYVVLSRVKTLDGLYLREPLNLTLQKYAMPPELAQFLAPLRQRAPLIFDDHDYQHTFKYTS